MYNKILILGAIFYSTEGLDCGIHFGKNAEVTATINKCINSNKTLEDLWDMAPMSAESDSSSSEEDQSNLDDKMSFKTKRSTNNTEEQESVAENCIIQCIFDNLEMTDSTGYPAHAKILEGLTKNATNRELKDFLQDTTDECFQEMDKENTMDPCAYSIKLVSCLAEKGKTNCADWPVGDLPFHE